MMSRKRYWLGAAMPLVVALTTIAWADGPGVVLTGGLQYAGPLVSLSAANVTLPELAKQMSAAIGCEVRIEGSAPGTVTLNAKDVTAAALLSQAETRLGGRWQVVYHLSTHDPAPPSPPPSGEVLNLSLPDISCQAGAAMVARMAGARFEHDGALAGRVSLVGTAMPVEQAMDTIAHAAHATWRRIYVMKVDALPQTRVAQRPDTDPSASHDAHQPAKNDQAGPKLWSNHLSASGHPVEFRKRDWRHPKKASYADGIKAVAPTMEEIEKQQMLGLYGPFFLLDSEDSQKEAMKRFQSGLETQIKRLEAIPANQRRITTQNARSHFQQLLDDFANLNDDQKKEAQDLYDYAKEQLSKPPLKAP